MCVSGFRELYENEQLFDVILSVGGKEFHGHKSLLAASSDYFRAMFTTELAEKDKKVWFWLEDGGSYATIHCSYCSSYYQSQDRKYLMKSYQI